MAMLSDAETSLRRRLRLLVGSLCLLLVVGRLLGYGESVDLKLLDAWFSLRGERPASPQVVIVGLDEKSQGVLGPIPWAREEYIPLIERLSAAGASVIGFDVTFTPAPRQEEANHALAEAMRKAGNVVIGIEFSSVGDPSPPGTRPEATVLRNALPSFDQSALALLAAPVLVPTEPAIAAAAAALGHVNAMPDRDGALRQMPLLIKHGPDVFPNLGLQIARVYTQTAITDIGAHGSELRVDYASIPLTESGRILLNWTGQANPFPVYPFVDVTRGDVPDDAFSGKAVLIAPTAKGIDRHSMPISPDAPGVYLHATFLSNFFTLQFLKSPNWVWLVEIGMVVLALVLVLLPFPILGAGRLLPLALTVIVTMLIASVVLFAASGIWLKVGLPISMMSGALIPILALRLKHSEKVTVDADTERRESQKLLGLSFQEKGMLDMALATFDRLPMAVDMLPVYYALGVDYEHRGQAEKALLAYKRIIGLEPNYEDTQERTDALRQKGASTRVFAQATIAQQGEDAEEATHMLEGEADATRGLEAPVANPQRVVVAGEMKSFGRYEVKKKLGRGAMGEVFLVEDTQIGRRAALKTIRLDLDMSSEEAIQMRQRFYREAQTAGRLSHRNLITIFDVGEDQGVAYIVMEFVEGQTLREAAKKARISPRQVKNLLIQAALGLDYAHVNGVVHRDVKPDNIMIGNDGVVKVMDFGVARLRESEMTKAGSILGTPAYMSPEQCSGKTVDGRSDVFSLGVILYELITGVRPFLGEQPTTVMLAILQKQPALPSSVGGAHAIWDPVIQRVLAKDPADRYATAKEFAEAMNGVKV